MLLSSNIGKWTVVCARAIDSHPSWLHQPFYPQHLLVLARSVAASCYVAISGPEVDAGCYVGHIVGEIVQETGMQGDGFE
ncbi:hypothetical protein RRG08_043731 [Elysia crispata]|uniref:Uncharacterized protein n=1 Tax=Elysia crispata TaxID=231223 RepID=A0AAE1DJ42_9GAST|nr:hypothetical protein RRG08_043731 [Elysia crispata]